MHRHNHNTIIIDAEHYKIGCQIVAGLPVNVFKLLEQNQSIAMQYKYYINKPQAVRPTKKKKHSDQDIDCINPT